MSRQRLALLLLPLTLAACTPKIDANYDEPGLSAAITRAYVENEVEEPYTFCTLPRIRAITRTDLVEEDANRLVLDVRYNYWDPTGSTTSDDFPFAFGDRDCEGFATRRFTLERDPLRVVTIGPARDLLR